MGVGLGEEERVGLELVEAAEGLGIIDCVVEVVEGLGTLACMIAVLEGLGLAIGINDWIVACVGI